MRTWDDYKEHVKKVDVEAKDLCYRYIARVLKDVKIGADRNFLNDLYELLCSTKADFLSNISHNCFILAIDAILETLINSVL